MGPDQDGKSLKNISKLSVDKWENEKKGSVVRIMGKKMKKEYNRQNCSLICSSLSHLRVHVIGPGRSPIMS